MTQVSVMRNKYVPSWPKRDDGEQVYVLGLVTALTRPYGTDAHFAAYASPNGRRLSRDALDGLDGGVALTVVVFDVDCPNVHGSGEGAPRSWRAEFAERFAAMRGPHPGGYLYWTRGGARIVYRQGEPTLIRGHADAREWSRSYAVALAFLARRFDIHADPACADWQRLFRLPRATREPGGKPEAWGAIGSAHEIAALEIHASAEDITTAQQASKAFRQRRELDMSGLCSVGDGHGLLFHALAAQGGVVRRVADSSYVIRCPNEGQHTSGRTGDGSTLLYLPAAGEEVGAIHCLHAHCAGLTVRGWLRFFTAAELTAARQRAGLSRLGAA